LGFVKKKKIKLNLKQILIQKISQRRFLFKSCPIDFKIANILNG
jgi:hypothetical protein